MSENLPVNDKGAESMKPAPYELMKKVSTEIFVELGWDVRLVDSFIGDMLVQKKVDGAHYFFRLEPDEQRRELLGLLEDPSSEEEIRVLFQVDAIPDDLKAHYSKTSEST